MDDLALFKQADNLACELLNSLREEHKCEYPLAFLTVAIMFGRLRHSARQDGADLNRVDTLFTVHATTITETLDKE